VTLKKAKGKNKSVKCEIESIKNGKKSSSILSGPKITRNSITQEENEKNPN
jgi:hypothetical protein